jgi:hypothetical protein
MQPTSTTLLLSHLISYPFTQGTLAAREGSTVDLLIRFVKKSKSLVGSIKADYLS